MTEPERFDLLKVPGMGRKKEPRQDKKYATFNRRMMAATFDTLFLLPLMLMSDKFFPMPPGLLSSYMAAAGDLQAMQQWWIDLAHNEAAISAWMNGAFLQVLVFCVYSAVCWYFWSATPGKILLRLKVVDAKTEAPISFGQILFRSFGYLISGMLFMAGFFWIGIDKRRQGWHDKLADTVVIVLPWLPKSNSQAAGPSGSPGPSSAE